MGNYTVHSKPLSDVESLRERVSGLVKRVGDLEGETKTLRAKIAGQRAVLRVHDEVRRILTGFDVNNINDAALAANRARMLVGKGANA